MFWLRLLSSVSCLGLQYMVHHHYVRGVRLVVNCMGEYESDGCTPSAACRAIREKFGVSVAGSGFEYHGVLASYGES